MSTLDGVPKQTNRNPFYLYQQWCACAAQCGRSQPLPKTIVCKDCSTGPLSPTPFSISHPTQAPPPLQSAPPLSQLAPPPPFCLEPYYYRKALNGHAHWLEISLMEILLLSDNRHAEQLPHAMWSHYRGKFQIS